VTPYEPPERFNLAAYLLDARLEEGGGDRVAIRTAAGTVSYRELAAMTSRMARVLEAADIRPEERVIIAMPDGPLFVAALLGIIRRGAIAVMINPDLPAEATRYFFEYTRARAAFVDAAREAAFAAATLDLMPAPHLLVANAAFEAALDALPAGYRTFDSHRDDAAIWLFSGGTTGRPKAVVQSHRSYANTTELYGKGVLQLGPSDITMAVPKLYFGYAMGSNVFFPFSVGASCVLFPERSTADELFAQIRRHRPTVLVNVPTMVQQMVAHPDAGSQDLSCLRLATSAGEALPAELHGRWMERFGVDLLDGLGTAEMWHIFISNRPGAVVPGTLGSVVPGFEVRLCDGEVARCPMARSGPCG
jgi:acyl-coenzyme A synthetase/AMP-(fatty) acid ligase